MFSTIEAHATPFSRIGPYVDTLRRLAKEPSTNADWTHKCYAALNGEASKMLRSEVPLATRREFGAFFTGSSLANSLVKHLILPNDKQGVYYDPTCGMGDLLLSVASRLPLKRTLQLTLKSWGKQLTGTDLHQEFVDAAKARLLLFARHRHGASGEKFDPLVDYFPGIRVANALMDVDGYQKATHVLMNPPFGSMEVGKRYAWTSGSMTAAAVFVADALKKIKENTQILAVLPEVLRSGSLSRHWQDTICREAKVKLVEPYGIFDSNADIDVFMLSLIGRGNKISNEAMWPKFSNAKTVTLGDHFDVHVGRVVPHRDPQVGKQLPYINPRSIEPWTVTAKIAETRQHHAPGYKAPFVVIRRTSRAEQPYRATASVVANGIVYVENHLIVCQPKTGSLESCMQLMDQLKSDAVNVYLNDRIRCRHLTVSSVSAIPINL